MKYIVIGAGISGLSIANLLQDKGNEVIIFEKDSRAGGMIKCDNVNGNLFHRTGGHVFNTKNKVVMDWFWAHFDKEKEFTKTDRNSSVIIDGRADNIPYPIENHMYLFNEIIQKAFIKDLLDISKGKYDKPNNFEEFLLGRFGRTLYNLYFKPYNYKVWHRDLTKVPLSWLEGKLPMPTVEEIMFNNINHLEEHSFVHSSFFYPKSGGSQFIADRLSQNLDIKYNTEINQIEKKIDSWFVNGIETDKIIFCGNIKQLPKLIHEQIDISIFSKSINELESHGTTSVFCEIDKNPYSWMYMPSYKHKSHRIICTGNFSPYNNAKNKMTATVEFTDKISKKEILSNLTLIPYSPKYLTHNFEKYTYPIQNENTRLMITDLKKILEPNGFYLLGRFAEWEYYNMDVAIGAAIKLSESL